jgi:hypothetical protein
MDYSKFNFPPYEYHEYPKWVGDVIVQNAEEEKALREATSKRTTNRKDK